MARKTTVAPAEQVGPAFMDKTPLAMAEPEARRNQIEAAYSSGRDLVNQIMGQSQALSMIAKFSATCGVSQLAFIKENKLYRDIAGMKISARAEKLSGTWEELCGLIGRSVDQVDRDIANLKAFGEEALESMSSMGLGYREMRDFRRLPADERLALIDAAKTGDKDALLDLAETLIARHTKEKEVLAQQVEELSANAEAHEKIMAGKDAKVNELDKRLKKAERRVATLDPDDKLAEIRAELLGFAVEAEGAIVNKLRPAFQMLTEHIAEHGGACDEYLSGCLGQIEQRLRELREEYGLNQADVAVWAKG